MSFSVCCSEPSEWLFAAEVQERLWVAEIVGRFHQFLPVFLQVTPGKRLLHWSLIC